MNQKPKPQTTCVYAVLTSALLLIAAGCSTNTAKLTQTGNTALVSGDYSAAAQSFQQIPHDERTEETSLKLAWLYWKQGQTQACLKELATFKENRPPQADYLAALCYLRQNDLARARQFAERSLQGDPRNSLAIALMGQIMFLEKQYPQSIEAYQAALEMASDEAVRLKLHYNLAMAYLQAGDFQRADQSFKQYLVRQKFISSEDNRMAGSIAYANNDHQRAYRHWSQLDPAAKKQILDVIVEDSELHAQLSGQR